LLLPVDVIASSVWCEASVFCRGTLSAHMTCNTATGHA